MKKLSLEIKHNSEDNGIIKFRKLHLHADNMNEMIEKIIDWQTMNEENKKYYDKKGKLQSEIDSGWYYINKSK